MIPVLLILIPLLTGLAAFLFKEEKAVKGWALFGSLITLVVAVTGAWFYPVAQLTYDAAWLPSFGARIHLSMDGMGKMLCLLTAISFPVVFAATSRNTYKNAGSFYGLMLLTQAGLTGVFLAQDALLLCVSLRPR